MSATPANSIVTTEPPIVQLIRKHSDAIAAALPSVGITPERMIRFAFGALRNVPKLMDCDQLSVLASIVQCAQLGLEPNTALGHCWILPFNNKAQLIIGYKGYVVLAHRCGFMLNGGVVREGDRWEFPMPGDKRIIHVPSSDQILRPRICAYAWATHADGGFNFRVAMPRDIERARQSSYAVQKKKMDSPWFGDENGKPMDTDAMWMKTGVHRLTDFLPLTSDAGIAMRSAVAIDDAAERGETVATDWLPAELTQGARVDELRERIEQQRESQEI